MHVFNTSLNSGVFSEKMKIAKIIPVFKTGDEAELGNYRPISILSVFSKLLRENYV